MTYDDDVEHADSLELPASLQRLWRGTAPGKGGPALSLERIVQAAVELADAEGLAGLSMAHLAERLGSAPMSLYRHIASKDELYDFMVDAAATERPARAISDDWRVALTDWAIDLIEVYRRHPWILGLPVTRPPLEPGQLDWLERGLQAQRSTALSDRERIVVVLTLLQYARGHAALVVALEAAPDPTFGFGRPYGQVLAHLVTQDRHPALFAAVEAGVFEPAPPDVATDLAADFRVGLNLILDGVAELIRDHA